MTTKNHLTQITSNINWILEKGRGERIRNKNVKSSRNQTSSFGGFWQGGK
jgi:hypothetical protein